MEEKLYIPSKLKVGFDRRHDTYTNKLGFITYEKPDGTGIRHGKNWTGWVKDDFPIEHFDNSPVEGFVINESVVHYSDWGSDRTYVRIYDSRDFEINITVDNLIYILQHTDALRKGFVGKFVYGYYGNRNQHLALIPVESEIYKKSVEHTTLQDSKVEEENLIVGATYLDGTGKSLIYLGKQKVYDFDSYKTTKSKVSFSRNDISSRNYYSYSTQLETNIIIQGIGSASYQCYSYNYKEPKTYTHKGASRFIFADFDKIKKIKDFTDYNKVVEGSYWRLYDKGNPDFFFLKDLKTIKTVQDETVSVEYAECLDYYNSHSYSGDITEIIEKPISIPNDGYVYNASGGHRKYFYKKLSDNIYISYLIGVMSKNNNNSDRNNALQVEVAGILEKSSDNKILLHTAQGAGKLCTFPTSGGVVTANNLQEQLKAYGLIDLHFKLDNGTVAERYYDQLAWGAKVR